MLNGGSFERMVLPGKPRESRYTYQLGLVVYGDTVQPLLTCTVSEMTNITKFNIVYLYDYVYQLTALAQICRSFF